jgi:hypothetical protein
MEAVSSPPLGRTVAQTTVRFGIPPIAFNPGFHVVLRSAAMIPVVSVVEGSATSTVAVAVLEVSATLVAWTVYVPAVAGAVYRPVASMAPAAGGPGGSSAHVTDVVAAPVTVALNSTFPSGVVEAAPGSTTTRTSWLAATPGAALLPQEDTAHSAAIAAATGRDRVTSDVFEDKGSRLRVDVEGARVHCELP